jgi:hypothetical protein
MEIGKVHISKVYAQTVCCKTITCGIAGAKVALEYGDELWDGLKKKVVFTNGIRTVEHVASGNAVAIPPEVVDTADREVRIGVCGVDAKKGLVIPTLWASLGIVREAVPTEADETEGASPPVWAQLLAKIGDLGDLKTEAKEDLVAAVNELAEDLLTDGSMAIEDLAQAGIITPVADGNNAVFVDENSYVYIF